MVSWIARLLDQRGGRHRTEEMERRSADIAVRDSEARLRAVLDAAVDGIVTIDEHGRIESVNPAVQRLFGYTQDELLGRNVSVLMPSPYHEEHDGYLENYHRTGRARIIGIGREVVARRKDGSVFPVHLAVSELRLGDRRLFTGMVRDISDRKRVEQDLEAARWTAEHNLAQLRATIESMTDAMAVVDASGQFVFVNSAFLGLHGLTRQPEDLEEYRAMFEAYDAAGRVLPVAERPLARALRGEAFQGGELELRRTGLDRVFIGSCSAAPVRDRGRVVMAVMTIHDITARKEAEAALRESEERFRTMADSAPVLIWMTDEHGNGVYFNRTWLQFTGRSLEQEAGQGWRQLVAGEDWDALALRDQACAQRRPFRTQFRLRRADGAYRWLLDSGVPRFAAGGRFAGHIGSCTDITQQKRAEEERVALLASERAARSEAERASRLKDEFLATLSHELRTPLNAILGWAQLLRRKPPAPELLAEGLSTIERSARAQTQLISDLLDMSRIISGKLRLEFQQVDVRDPLNAALDTVRPAAAAKDIALHPELGVDPVFVRGDAGRLQQVFWNLLFNAIKFTPRSGRVQVNLVPSASHVAVSVCDSGMGIRPDFFPHLFQRFRQLDSSTTREHRGLGLGLSIVKQLVELHGGEVQAESEGPGHGATFTVALPRVFPRALDLRELSPVAERHQAAALSELACDFGGLRILAVDDERDALDLLQRLLADRGAEVLTAESAEEALDLLKRRQPDVLISDIGMPRLDGYELIRQVRRLPIERGGAIPAVAVTAFARGIDRQVALQAGYNAHLSKPVEPGELLSLVAALAGRACGQA
ncbi:MAG: PAS domain S-box protein [Planctomycetota bacterium]